VTVAAVASPGGHYRAADGTFRKPMSHSEATAELRGYRAVAGHLPVPRLVGAHGRSGGVEIVYEDVFASGRCRRLLADAINAADRDPGQLPAIRSLVDDICDSILATADATASRTRLADCVPALYAARLAPGGRIDRCYTHPPRPIWTVNRHRLSLDDLAAATLVIHGKARGAFSTDLDRLRTALAADTRWTTTISQGDPTEPNIAEPLCWLDFEHAGRNALAGDLAILIWYLLAMGNWLVPTYQPATYARTLTTPLPPGAEPAIDHLTVSGRHIEINYSWSVGAGRHAAIQALLHRLDRDLGKALNPTGDLLILLRPFLTMRVLGVIPLAQLSGPHAILCVAKLAELTDPDTTLRAWCHTVPVSPDPA
jgi:hypothetical protein